MRALLALIIQIVGILASNLEEAARKGKVDERHGSLLLNQKIQDWQSDLTKSTSNNKRRDVSSLENDGTFKLSANTGINPLLSTSTIRKTRSDSASFRQNNQRSLSTPSSPPMSQSDEEIHPLSKIVEPRPPRLLQSPGASPQKARSRRSSHPRPRAIISSDPDAESLLRNRWSKYENINKEDLRLKLVERRFQYLEAKSHYAKTKLDYEKLKYYMVFNQNA